MKTILKTLGQSRVWGLATLVMLSATTLMLAGCGEGQSGQSAAEHGHSHD